MRTVDRSCSSLNLNKSEQLSRIRQLLTMRRFRSLFSTSLALFFLSSVALASYAPQLEILYWPVSNPQPSVLAHVSYDPASLKSDLIDYTPPSAAETSEDIVRVGFYISTPLNPKQWVGTLTSLAALRGDNDQKPTLRLHISPSNEVYSVSLASDSSSTSSSSSVNNPRLQLVTDELGPRPHLNRPIVVGPDGKDPEEVPEKTLFQKYWWVFLILTFLAMSGGGEQQ
ncbi:hypothetical protein ASPCAL03606 [Aspergillus calidoustus]|uniref:Uncharacterized protein n=1 Tax=Aspergillus calidoustus TaxID=454130 RepID=A0A0U5GNU9_ASPCI|nr:hypothetical protein ASPCAL03606 [Aspergillus calidoustus]